jgi:phospholipid-binding lipoprotein MlaA
MVPNNMKYLLSLSVLLLLLAAGCAHGPEPAASAAPPGASTEARQVQPAAPPAPLPASAAGKPAVAETATADEYGDIEDFEEIDGEGKDKGEIADPLEPFNRAMFHFNDKLYFWVLKPVAQGYSVVVPEPARVSVSNFFTNLAFPIRFVNALLQANLTGAAAELGRFTVNTLWGIGGLLDPASSREIALEKQDEDFGQTLGVYGLGPGFFINWPVFGPSSPRDTIGRVGDGFLSPIAYLTPWYAAAGARATDMVNATSLRIGDYEAIKAAAIDPYVAMRNAYAQYRLQKIQRRGGSGTMQSPDLPRSESSRMPKP